MAKKGPTANRVEDALADRPGDREAVDGAGAAPDFVHHHETLGGRRIEDEGCLVHLDEERALAASEIVLRAHAAIDFVDHPDLGVEGRHEGARLGHERDEGGLP